MRLFNQRIFKSYNASTTHEDIVPGMFGIWK